MSNGNKTSDDVWLCDRLPDGVLERTIGFEAESGRATQIGYLEARLPRSDVGEIQKSIRKNFPLTKERRIGESRYGRNGGGRRRSRHLSATKKRELGLYTVRRRDLKFNDVLPIHALWCSYMEEYMGFKDLPVERRDELIRKEEFCQSLCKADYHGAYIIVVRSLCPSLVGIEGILVFETKNTLKLVSQDDVTRSVPKEVCEFQLRIGDYRLQFLGKNFLIRPTERSKKIKLPVHVDL